MKQNITIDLKNENCFKFLKEIKTNTIDLILIDPPLECLWILENGIKISLI